MSEGEARATLVLACALAKLIGACEGISGPMIRDGDEALVAIGRSLAAEAAAALQELRRVVPTA